MPQKPLYETILFDDLRFTPEFFKEREETINEKLSRAGTDLARDNGDIFAINQCLHLAISLVLLKTANLNAGAGSGPPEPGLLRQGPDDRGDNRHVIQDSPDRARPRRLLGGEGEEGAHPPAVRGDQLAGRQVRNGGPRHL